VFFVAVLGFFLYAIRPVLQAWLLESTPRNMGGTSIGVLFGAQALGSSIGPLLGGLVADSYGLTATFAFLAGTIVAANLFILFMPKTEPATRERGRPRCGEVALQHLEPHFRSLAGRDLRSRGRVAARHSWIEIWGLPLLAWGYLQYRLVGNYRSREGGGGRGFRFLPSAW